MAPLTAASSRNRKRRLYITPLRAPAIASALTQARQRPNSLPRRPSPRCPLASARGPPRCPCASSAASACPNE
eukprot:8560530-Pyramimonas_sp.AAC.1